MKLFLVFLICLTVFFIACEKNNTTPQEPQDPPGTDVPDGPSYPPNPGIPGPGIWVSYSAESSYDSDTEKSVLAKYSFDGELMVYMHFLSLRGVAVNKSNGVVWAKISNLPDRDSLFSRISDTGEVLNGIPTFFNPGNIGDSHSIHDASDSCWTNFGAPGQDWEQVGRADRYDSNFNKVASSQFGLVWSVCCDKRDCSCWVQEAYPPSKVKISANGTRLFSFDSAISGMIVDNRDGSMWTCASIGSQYVLRKYDENGNWLFDISYDGQLWNFCVSPGDGSLACIFSPNDVVRYDANGNLIWQTVMGTSLNSLDVSNDGSIWLSDLEGNKIYHVSPVGIKLSEFTTLVPPEQILVRE